MALTCKAFGDIITFTRASSATFVGSNGLIQSATTNTPRFDYDPVTLAAKGLLIEEQRTNLLTYSEQFDNAAWVRSGITTITPNATTAPDGSVTADRYVESNLNEVHSLSSASVSATSGVTYTLSVYAKDAGRFLRLILPMAVFGNFVSANFDLVNGVAYDTAGTGATIQNVGSGWYRCAIRVTATTTASGAITVSTAQTSSGTGSYAGDGTSGVFLWGAQLEAGSFATSYIPTVASQVTRSADVASVNTLSPWYNATEGTLYTDAALYGYGSASMIAAFTSGPTNIIQHFYNSATSLRYSSVDASVLQAELTQSGLSLNTAYKMASAFKLNDFAVSVNGGAVLTDTSGTVPSVTTLGIGNRNSLLFFNGHIRRITYYPRRLSNAELQAITA